MASALWLFHQILTSSILIFLSLRPPPLRYTLFPYTTLFRSVSMVEGPSRRIRCSFSVLGKLLRPARDPVTRRSEDHTSELQSLTNLVCRLLLEKKKNNNTIKEDIKKHKKPLLSQTTRDKYQQ